VTFGLAPWIAFVLALGCHRRPGDRGRAPVLRPLSGQPPVAVLMATIGIASIVHGGSRRSGAATH
jgi:branched-chain amino acid transport system permease protein